jgi:hypothetical protein
MLFKYSCNFIYEVPIAILIKSKGNFGLTTSDMIENAFTLRLEKLNLVE